MAHFVRHDVKFRAAALTETAANALSGQTLASLFGTQNSTSLDQALEDHDVENIQRDNFQGKESLSLSLSLSLALSFLAFTSVLPSFIYIVLYL